MRSVPPREWLAVLLPILFGVVLLLAGAASAADADAWLAYVLAACVGAALPLGYTVQLVRERRLFLRSDRDVARSRSRRSGAISVGWLVAGVALVAVATLGGSGRAAIYAAFGGASLGIFPGLFANFIRLWREKWAPARFNDS
jgi:4-amino-4-deoxy-L-arabinose transferase-like glycosyltransferase